MPLILRLHLEIRIDIFQNGLTLNVTPMKIEDQATRCTQDQVGASWVSFYTHNYVMGDHQKVKENNV